MDCSGAALKLLVVERDCEDAPLVLDALHRARCDFRHRHVRDEMALLAALEDETWDAVTAVCVTPSGALDALAVVRQFDPEVPFIVVSREVVEDGVVAVLRAGAQDVVASCRMQRLIEALVREGPAAERRREQRHAQGSLRDSESQRMMSDRLVQVGMLAAGIAHEINNPLACVLANTELALADLAQLPPGAPIDPAIIEEIRDAHEAAKRVRDIVQDIRIFSRGNDAEEGPVDVQAVLESSLRLAWNEIRHRATVVRDYDRVPMVSGTDARLGQVFLNLLVNAAQALPEGRASEHEIRLTTRYCEGKVIVTVADNGPGIADSVMPRLFTPFVTTKPAGIGTGLGLSISRRIVTQLGGELRARNLPNRGAAFDVVLPSSREQARTHAPSIPIPRPLGQGARVLLIDDEAMVRRIVPRVLGGRHHVEAVSTAAEALERIATGARYDVILCDLMMPEMTGMEFFEELSHVCPMQQASVVFMTGGAFTPAANAFMERVSNPRIEKPFTAKALHALVEGRLP